MARKPGSPTIGLDKGANHRGQFNIAATHSTTADDSDEQKQPPTDDRPE
jgi:hypothetical protein